MTIYDNNFKEIEGKFDLKSYKGAYVEKKHDHFLIRSGDRSITIEHDLFDIVSRKKNVTAESILEHASKAHYGKDSKRLLAKFLLILGIFCLITTASFYFYRSEQSNKNFKLEHKVFVTNDDVEIGDYVDTSFYYLDGLDIKQIEKKSTLGILERSEEKIGNSYLLVTHEDINSTETFIVKYNINTEKGQELNSLIEEGLKGDEEFKDIIADGVKGEIKSIEDIESINEDSEIDDIFGETITNINEKLEFSIRDFDELFEDFAFQYESPRYLLDTTVERVSFENYVLYPTYGFFVLSLLISALSIALGVRVWFTTRSDLNIISKPATVGA